MLALRSLLIAGSVLLAATAAAQDQSDRPAVGGEAEDNGAFADQALGKRFEVKAEDLPEPYAEPAVRNPALTIDRGDHRPNVPEGFEVNLFAEDLDHPRQMLVLDNGDVLLAEQSEGRITLLRDEDGDGRADVVERFAQDFEEPYGLAQTNDGEILVADTRGIWRVPHSESEVRATGEEIYGNQPLSEIPEGERQPQQPMDHFPVTEQGVLGEAIGHTTRPLAIGPDDGNLYVGVGSAGNVGEEPEPHATIQVFDADGSNQRTFASGMRNPIGLAFHPETGELWAVVQERDGLGNRLVPDYLTQVQEGGFYGWPYAYIGSNPQPQFAERAPEKVEATLTPDLLFEAHSSSMDVVFYDGGQFPEEYRGDAFVALKGSWNRADPTGYKIVHVPFEGGKPAGGYENFVTGFWVEGDDRAVVWGRPADLALTPDGALLIADDTGGTIWKVSHQGGEQQRQVGAEPGAPETTGATGGQPAQEGTAGQPEQPEDGGQ